MISIDTLPFPAIGHGPVFHTLEENLVFCIQPYNKDDGADWVITVEDFKKVFPDLELLEYVVRVPAKTQIKLRQSENYGIFWVTEHKSYRY